MTRNNTKRTEIKAIGLLELGLLLVVVLVFSGCDKEEVPQPEVKPSLTINKLSNVEPTSISVEVSITTYGSKPVQEHGVVWSENPDPTVANTKVTYVKIDKPKTYVDTVANLKLNTIYYFKTYLINEAGEVIYSQEKSTKTLTVELNSFSPQSASGETEITVVGTNFIAGRTKIYFDNIIVNPVVDNSSRLRAVVPYGLKNDSVIVAVEMDGSKLSFNQKLGYKKGRWIKMKSWNDTPGYVNNYTNSISISGNGYVKGISEKSIYEYSQLTDSWNKITETPEATGYIEWFSIDRQLFLQTSSKFWMYDLDSKQWLGVPPHPNNLFPDTGISFAFDRIGYVGLGLKFDPAANKYLHSKEIFKYSPITLIWSRVNDFPGEGVYTPLSLSHASSVFVIGGSDKDQKVYSETWKYNPSNDSWIKKSNYPGKGSNNLAGFVVGDKIYVGCGGNGTDKYKDFWQYDIPTDKWTQVADFVGPRISMYSFSLSNKGYLGGGVETSSIGLYDLWRFDLE